MNSHKTKDIEFELKVAESKEKCFKCNKPIIERGKRVILTWNGTMTLFCTDCWSNMPEYV